MSDNIDKLMSALDKANDSIEDLKKSHAAELEAQKTGTQKLEADLAEQQKELQRFAMMAKRGFECSAERDLYAGFGKQIVDSARGKAASEGTDADGGYLVADEYSTKIKSAQNQYGLVRRVYGADIYPMASDVLKVPVDTYEETSGNTPVPAATSENAAISESDDAQLGQVTLTAQKYATLNPISNELIDDAFVDYIGAYLMPKLARQASKIEDQVVFTTATTGLLNSSNVEAVTMSETAFSDINFEYLLDMQDAVVDDALVDGQYIMHRSIVNLLRKQKGNDNYYWAPAAAGEPPMMVGYGYEKGSIFPAASASAVNTGFALFGDVKLGSVFGERLTRSIKVSEHYGFNTDQQYVRMTFRIALGTNSNIGKAIAVLKTAAA